MVYLPRNTITSLDKIVHNTLTLSGIQLQKRKQETTEGGWNAPQRSVTAPRQLTKFPTQMITSPAPYTHQFHRETALVLYRLFMVQIRADFIGRRAISHQVEASDSYDNVTPHTPTSLTQRRLWSFIVSQGSRKTLDLDQRSGRKQDDESSDQWCLKSYQLMGITHDAVLFSVLFFKTHTLCHFSFQVSVGRRQCSVIASMFSKQGCCRSLIVIRTLVICCWCRQGTKTRSRLRLLSLTSIDYIAHLHQ